MPHLLLIEVELHIPQARSLKDRRKVIRSLIDRLRQHFNAAVAETGYQDKWQRAGLSIAIVGNDAIYLEGQSQAILGFIEREILGSAQVVNWSVDQR